MAGRTITSTTLPPLNATIPRWQDLALLSNEEIAAIDVAVLNLAAVQGMPGAPTAEEAADCLRRLDPYAETVADYTEKCYPELDRYRDCYQGSEGKFRVLKMLVMLKKVHGIRYNPAKIPDESIHTEADAFIHGPLLGEGGTCASLPVVYTAVGRRLGYPMRLVASPVHLFARWEAGEDRLNVDTAANADLSSPPDDYYRFESKRPFTAEQERYFCYLQSKTAAQEFANFLHLRAHHWHCHGDLGKCVEAFAYACRLDPGNASLFGWHRARVLDWRTEAQGRMPLNFPLLKIDFPPRRYPWLEEYAEQQMIYCETAERLLDDPAKAGWWESASEVSVPAAPARSVFRPSHDGAIKKG